MKPRKRSVLAVASSGGHWIQLLRLRSAFEGCQLSYVTVMPPRSEEIQDSKVYLVNDANRSNCYDLLRLSIKLMRILFHERPDVIISTGAAPGCLAVCFGKLLGARTIWVDSIAFVDHLSLSGRIARRFSDLWLTQWPHLDQPGGPTYKGAVL